MTDYNIYIAKDRLGYFISLNKDPYNPIFRLGRTLDRVAKELGPEGWWRPYIHHVTICLEPEEETLLRQKIMLESL